MPKLSLQYITDEINIVNTYIGLDIPIISFYNEGSTIFFHTNEEVIVEIAISANLPISVRERIFAEPSPWIYEKQVQIPNKNVIFFCLTKKEIV